MKKANEIITKLIIWLPFIAVFFYTKTAWTYIPQIQSKVTNFFVDFLNMFYPISPYIFIGMTIVLIVFSFLKKNKKLTIVTIMTLIGAIITTYSSLAYKGFNYNLKVELAFISMYILGIVMLFLMDNINKNIDIEKTMKRMLQTTIIYIIIIYIFSIVTNSFFLSYNTIEQGIAAWFPVTNPFGHVLVMMLPLMMYYYFKDKNHLMIIYIILTILIMFVLGTKACYFAAYATIIISILLFIYKQVKEKKFNYKIITLITILLLALVFNNDLYAAKNIEENKSFEKEIIEETIIRKVAINEYRANHLEETSIRYSESSLLNKTFGMGVYYPKETYLYCEMDFFDILFQKGIFGLLLYLATYGYFAFILIKKIIKTNIKETIIPIILFSSSLGMSLVASFFAGHIMLNFMSLFMLIVTISFFNKYLESKVIK